MLRTVKLPSERRYRKSHRALRFGLAHLAPEAQLLVLLARTSANGTLQVEIQDRLREHVDWALLWKLARTHGVASLVYRTLVSYGEGAVPTHTMEVFRRHVQSRGHLNSLLVDELVALVEAFAAKGVRAIPFNGPTLAVTAYGDLALRECLDLDFIVGPSCVSQARHLLWSHGYQLVSQGSMEGEEQQETSYSFEKKNGMFRVNLQSAIARRFFAFDLDRGQFWNQLKPVRIGRRTIMSLGPEELLIVLCMQGSKHVWKDLKWLCDVAELVRRRHTMDWSRLLFLADEWGCRRLLLMGLAMAHMLFELPLPRSIQDAVSTDPDIYNLAKRMPRHLLRSSQEGVGEADAEVFYLTLKDSWIDQWAYALTLCQADGPLATEPPSWFKFRRRLTTLYHLVRPFHQASDWCTRFLRSKKALGKRLEIPEIPG
jgi:Uncharacterised nucleotidyltransferase